MVRTVLPPGHAAHGADGVRRPAGDGRRRVRYGDRMATRDARWLETLYPENPDRTLPWGEVGGRVTLYRPVGLAELHLITASGGRFRPGCQTSRSSTRC